MKRIVALLVFITLTWLGPPLRAEGSSPPSSGAGSSVLLINQGDQDLKFALRPADGKWVTYSVASGKSTMLACDQCKTPYFEFTMITDKDEVAYRLMPSETYLLYWNQDKRRWDLSHQESK